jgi:ribosome modulation factor
MTSARKVKQAFEQGKTDQLAGKSSSCPEKYDQSPEERKAWFDGYYETYLVQRHRETFKRYVIKFP